MRIFIVVALVWFKSIVTYKQENLVRWNEKERLDWNDFTGKVDDKSEFHAECFAEVGYRYHFNNPKDFQFDVYANFFRNISWIKKEYQTKALLKHEQLHFDIAELCALRLKNLFNNYNYTEDFETEIEVLFNQQKLEYHVMQQQYDEETDHSLNKDKQKEWEVYVANELNQIKFKEQIAQTNVAHARQGR